MIMAASQEGRGRPVFGRRDPDARGYFGEFGGRFVPETLVAPIAALEEAYFSVRRDAAFVTEFEQLLRQFVGRPTPLYEARRLTEACGGATVLLKREDLAHTGAHKINNALGQALLARRMGKRRVVAETGAGQHGVATATVCALLGPRLRRLHGRRRHGAAGAQRVPHAAARRRGARRRRRQPHAEGRDQRGDARLGGERARHPLPARVGARAASVSADGPRVPVGDRRGGARAVPRRSTGRLPDAARRLRRRRQQRHRPVRRVRRRSRRAPDRRRGRRRRHRGRTARGPLRWRRCPACCRARGPTCSRTRTATSR